MSSSSEGKAAIRSNNFDLIRLFAAFQVAFIHGTGDLGVGAAAGIDRILQFFPGVPIFFVVSGFLISLSWERSPSWRQYARNRLLRIYPALWVCLAVSIVIIFACGVRPDSLRHFAVWVAAQATIVQYYNPGFLRGFGVGTLNGSLWTIPVELQFYLVLPLLSLLGRKSFWRWVGLCLLAMVVMAVMRPRMTDPVSIGAKLLVYSLVPYLFYFLVGVVLRLAFERRPGIIAGRAMAYFAVYVVWIVIESHFGIAGATGNLLSPLSIVLLALLTVSAAFTGATLASRLLRGNDISYGLYIYHGPILNVLLYLQLFGLAGLTTFLVVVPLLAWLSWRLVERPALRLKNYTLRVAW